MVSGLRICTRRIGGVAIKELPVRWEDRVLEKPETDVRVTVTSRPLAAENDHLVTVIAARGVVHDVFRSVGVLNVVFVWAGAARHVLPDAHVVKVFRRTTGVNQIRSHRRIGNEGPDYRVSGWSLRKRSIGRIDNVPIVGARPIFFGVLIDLKYFIPRGSRALRIGLCATGIAHGSCRCRNIVCDRYCCVVGNGVVAGVC